MELETQHKMNVNDEEIKLYSLFRELYQIPYEADLHIDFDIDNNILILTSDTRLNIQSEDGFKLLKREEIKVTALSGGFNIINDEYTFKYYFKL